MLCDYYDYLFSFSTSRNNSGVKIISRLFGPTLRDVNHYPVNKKEYVLPYKFNSLTKSSNKIRKK